MATKSKSKTQTGIVGSWLVWSLVALAIIAAGMCAWVWKLKYYAVSACTTANVSLEAGQQSGAAGTIYQHMKLTNTGAKSCTIAGFPTAFLYGSNGYALGSAAAAQSQIVPTVITLAPGETAHTTLGYPQAGNFNPGVCSDMKSTMLRLYLPGGTAALETPLEVAWCPGFSSTAIQAGN